MDERLGMKGVRRRGGGERGERKRQREVREKERAKTEKISDVGERLVA